MISKQKKGQTILYAIFTCIISSIFLCCALVKWNNTGDEYIFIIDNAVGYWIAKSVCFICAIVCGVAAVWFIKQAFSDEPLAKVCDEYFLDNSSAVSFGKIAWTDMNKAYLKGGFLNIDLKNPDYYLQKKNWLQKKMIKGNLKLGFGHVCISPQRFKKDAEKFFDEFAKRMPVYILDKT